MKRYALIFLVAIFLPSLVLGWLALRTASEQRVLIERQAADLHQAESDAIALEIGNAIQEKQRVFVEAVHELVSTRGASALAENFGPALAQVWPNGGVSFAISPQGALVYPSPAVARRNREEENFLDSNGSFLNNTAEVEVYKTQQVVAQTKDEWRQSKPAAATQSLQMEASQAAQPNAPVDQQQQAAKSKGQFNRGISPQNNYANVNATVDYSLPSKVASEYSTFQTAVGGAAQGILARFVQDDLQVLFWTRPDPGNNWLFGLMLGPKEFEKMAGDILAGYENGETRIAILNEKARPVARVPENFTADWKHPFVATEIGETLPHWEVALYLTNPGKLTESANLVSITLVLLITLALAAILAGGYFVALDTRRQLALAQKKTDFVSNVSHELKTPLTSIRMFAELLADDRVKEPDKRQRFLRIIAGESDRLARLVNNVLDFARLEKNRKTYDMREVDLYPVIERIWESESLRLREAGFQVDWVADSGPYPVVGDVDAIAQILINLISNAEKYAVAGREILLRTELQSSQLLVEVLDRGPGVPRGMEDRIFEAFFRADDSLSSGVQGSGLGLTLARSIARAHHGDISYHVRKDGGGLFRLKLPLKSSHTS